MFWEGCVYRDGVRPFSSTNEVKGGSEQRVALSLFHHAVHGVRWIGISKLITQCFTWVSTIYIIRWLEPGDYGIVAMAGVVTMFAGEVLDATLTALVQR